MPTRRAAIDAATNARDAANMPAQRMPACCRLTSRTARHASEMAMYGISVKGKTLCLNSTKLLNETMSTIPVEACESRNVRQMTQAAKAATPRHARFKTAKPTGVAAPSRSIVENKSGTPTGNTGRAPLIKYGCPSVSFAVRFSKVTASALSRSGLKTWMM